jgi:hypothetical protein
MRELAEGRFHGFGSAIGTRSASRARRRLDETGVAGKLLGDPEVPKSISLERSIQLVAGLFWAD